MAETSQIWEDGWTYVSLFLFVVLSILGGWRCWRCARSQDSSEFFAIEYR